MGFNLKENVRDSELLSCERSEQI